MRDLEPGPWHLILRGVVWARGYIASEASLPKHRFRTAAQRFGERLAEACATRGHTQTNRPAMRAATWR